MNPASHSVDPITFEILSHRMHQIAKEMGATLERVGGTVNTTQMKDYMASLYRANGDILSAGDTTGWHVACAGFAVKRILERFGDDDGIYPDDLFLLNDPYLAAIHQSDVYILSPIHFTKLVLQPSLLTYQPLMVSSQYLERTPEVHPVRTKLLTRAGVFSRGTTLSSESLRGLDITRDGLLRLAVSAYFSIRGEERGRRVF